MNTNSHLQREEITPGQPRETNAKKTVVIGVSGGIACYKAVEVVNQLRKDGYNVKVIMTKAAQQFVTCLLYTSQITVDGDTSGVIQVGLGHRCPMQLRF